MRRALPLLFLFILTASTTAQEEVTIHGRVISPDPDQSFHGLMIVNKRTRIGQFGEPDGSFSVRAMRTDTILVGSMGHRTEPICMADSLPKAEYQVVIYLQPLLVQLRAAEVLPQRTLKQIQKDIDQLGYRERDYRINGVNAFESPITFLYQEFSRRERSKRLVAQLQNEDRKRALLKELLYKYVDYDIINLNDEAFDDFIDFCGVPDEVIMGLSQYDFLFYIKKKYELYSRLGPTRAH